MERLESDNVGYGRNLEGIMMSEEWGEAMPNEDTLEPDASYDLTRREKNRNPEP